MKTLGNVHQSPNTATHVGLDEWNCIKFIRSLTGLLPHSSTHMEGSCAGSGGDGGTREHRPPGAGTKVRGSGVKWQKRTEPSHHFRW